MKRSYGFTLIELIVATAIAVVLLAVAVPSFQDASVASKVSDNANRLAASASVARGEAIKRNGPVVLCMSDNGGGCVTAGGWEQGWMVFHDANRNAAFDAGEAVIATEGPAPAGYRITEGSGTSLLTFQPTSIGTTMASWSICRAQPSVHAQQRQVDVGATGRASIKRISAGSCP